MQKAEISENVKKIIRDIRVLSATTPIPDDAHLIEDLQFDSYDIIELMLELELRFELDQSVMTLDAMQDLRTVTDIVTYIHEVAEI